MHMIKFEFLDLLHLKQIKFIISIHIHGKFHLSITFAFVGFQKDIHLFIPQIKIGLKGKALVAPLTIIPNDNV